MRELLEQFKAIQAKAQEAGLASVRVGHNKLRRIVTATLVVFELDQEERKTLQNALLNVCKLGKEERDLETQISDIEAWIEDASIQMACNEVAEYIEIQDEYIRKLEDTRAWLRDAQRLLVLTLEVYGDKYQK